METDKRFPHVIWMNLIACAWLLIVPMFLPHSNGTVKWNEAIAAVVIAVASMASMLRGAHHWLDRAIVFIAGLWLTISPFHMAYPPVQSGGAVLIGCLVMTITALEMVQATSHRLTM